MFGLTRLRNTTMFTQSQTQCAREKSERCSSCWEKLCFLNDTVHYVSKSHVISIIVIVVICNVNFTVTVISWLSQSVINVLVAEVRFYIEYYNCNCVTVNEPSYCTSMIKQYIQYAWHCVLGAPLTINYNAIFCAVTN